jgi:hypothetical protein
MKLAVPSNSQLAVITANVVPSYLILFTVMMEAIRSSEMSILTRATRRNNLKDSIFHSHCRGNLKSYKTWIKVILVNYVRNYEMDPVLIGTQFVWQHSLRNWTQ